MTSSMNHWPLVGRRGELEAFRQSLAASDRDSCVIYGRAGVGKTRLAEECFELAVQQGHVCHRAGASDATRTIPLGAIAHLLRGTPASPIRSYSSTRRSGTSGPSPEVANDRSGSLTTSIFWTSLRRP
ncbi:ATP-binding protein [Streptomyces sp. NPDC051776]|uniref:ATP-binding protein n=1 Tax=Streptomyces sp. NPDC051776 TaxID=3155414 RepID=UPI00341ED19A